MLDCGGVGGGEEKRRGEDRGGVEKARSKSASRSLLYISSSLARRELKR